MSREIKDLASKLWKTKGGCWLPGGGKYRLVTIHYKEFEQLIDAIGVERTQRDSALDAKRPDNE